MPFVRLPKVPDGITCTDWESARDPQRPKRCKYITRELKDDLDEQRASWVPLEDGRIWRGQCQVTTRLICEEWLKIHPEDALVSSARPTLPTLPSAVAPPLPPVERDLFGGIVPPRQGPSDASRPPRTAHRLPGRFPTQNGTEVSPPPISPEWIASLERSGLEVTVGGGVLGEVHLVAERSEPMDDETPSIRLELTYAEAAALRAIVDLFPDAELIAIRKQRPPTRIGYVVKPPIASSEELAQRLKRLDTFTGVPKDELAERIKQANERKL